MDYAYRHILITHEGAENPLSENDKKKKEAQEQSPPLWVSHLEEQLNSEGGFMLSICQDTQLIDVIKQADGGEYDVIIFNQKAFQTIKDIDEIKKIACLIMVEEGQSLAGDGLSYCDYIERPFHLSALITKLHQMIGKVDRQIGTDFNIGFWHIDIQEKRLSLQIKAIEGAKKPPSVALTDKETMILFHLLRAKGAVVSKDRLLHRLWGYQQGTQTHTIETHIYKLRQKFIKLSGDDSNHPIPLITKDQGYGLFS